MAHKKLFIPGPTEVAPEVLRAMGTPMIGHREKAFTALYTRVMPKLKQALYTKGRVFLSTSSASGIMEGAIRNCVSRRVLSCVCGAFSERWYEIARANGKEADPYVVEWGQVNDPAEVDKRLATGRYDAVTWVHNETSTGVMGDFAGMSQVMRKYPDVSFLVDTVSSMMGVKIDVDALAPDVCLAGVQKAFSLPPGLTVFTVSERALAKAKTIPHRGAYFDFTKFAEFDEKGQTPETPSISHIYALDVQMDRILAEGLENRWARHAEMARTCRAWARERFGLFAAPGAESTTLTTVKNTRGIDVGRLIKTLSEKHDVTLGNGYGKLKDKTFRIAHMGETTIAEIKELLSWIDAATAMEKSA